MNAIGIKGMSCEHCVASVKEALEKVPGLSAVTVDLEKGRATFTNTGATELDITEAISTIGFEPFVEA